MSVKNINLIDNILFNENEKITFVKSNEEHKSVFVKYMRNEPDNLNAREIWTWMKEKGYQFVEHHDLKNVSAGHVIKYFNRNTGFKTNKEIGSLYDIDEQHNLLCLKSFGPNFRFWKVKIEDFYFLVKLSKKDYYEQLLLNS